MPDRREKLLRLQRTGLEPFLRILRICVVEAVAYHNSHLPQHVLVSLKVQQALSTC